MSHCAGYEQMSSFFSYFHYHFRVLRCQFSLELNGLVPHQKISREIFAKTRVFSFSSGFHLCEMAYKE